MLVSLIVAASQNGVIGFNHRLPWHLPADLKRFKQLTMGHPIIMGRNTFESIGKPLPGRTNIVLSRQKGLKPCGCLVADSLEKALELCRGQEGVFVVGGAGVYREALKTADRIHLTLIHQDFQGDAFLFPIDPALWQETARQDFPADSENPFPFSFILYERVPGPRPGTPSGAILASCQRRFSTRSGKPTK